ncbi:MAG: hypothetical protein D3924_00190 [Candidatus Electrothrix sp. AR4]|nr:hypothetical protein [Candidatus Electrothrix sp. AR4]
MTENKPYEIRLSGNIQNILLVGAISVLADRGNLRVATGIMGFLLLIIGMFLTLANGNIYHPLARLDTPTLIFGFALTLVSILSGKNFNIHIGEPREVEEREKAEEELKDKSDPYSSLDLDSKRLSEYYAINQKQARGSFRWAVTAMLVGLLTIVAGVWIFYLGDKPDTFLTSLSTAGGIVVNCISVLYLYLHNRTQKRALFYYGQLVRLQQLGFAMRIAESHHEEKDKSSAKNQIITQILAIVNHTAIEETKAVSQQEA